MTRTEQIAYLIDVLLEEMPQYRAQAEQETGGRKGRELLRALMNVRPPMPLNADFLAVQDALLQAERDERGVVGVSKLPATSDPRVLLWRGDITRLAADAIVNAANAAMLGCFVPCHSCIDNAIHSAAGLQLRDECHRLMRRQGHDEPAGCAKLTKGYNLPAKYVLHTVGPIVTDAPTREDRRLLASCYRSCLQAAGQRGLKSIAFCCISTGVFHFPNQEAASIAVDTVKDELKRTHDEIKVIFNVFTDTDEQIYRGLLR